MTVYFDNCLGACREAAMDLPDRTSVSEIIFLCITKWGEGSLRRMRNELIWCHDRDAEWVGCCAEKIQKARTA